jgi:hypothetical protein
MPTPSYDSASEQYLNNAEYEATASVEKARLFQSACRQLLLLMPKSAGEPAGGNLATNSDLVRAELQAVTAWLASNDTGNTSRRVGGRRFASFEGFRD